MRPHEAFICDLLKMRFKGTPATPPEALDRPAFFKIIKAHEIGPLLYQPLKELNIDETFIKYPKEAYYRAAEINTRQNALYDKVRRRLNKEKIRHLPIKGIVLEWFYTPRFVRTKGDIDVLVDEAKIARVDAALKDMGFTRESTGEAHDVYKKFPLLLEVHKRLFPASSTYQAVFRDVWDFTRIEEGYTYALEIEAHMAYVVAHIAKHFKSAGAGLRMLYDLAVLLETEHDNARFIAFVEALGLKTFYRSLADLAARLLGADTEKGYLDKATEEALALHMLRSGTFGLDNPAQIETVRTAREGTVAYYLKKAFLPFSSLKYRYPFLKKAPFLYPFVLAYRNAKLLFSPRMRRRVFARRTRDEKRHVKALYRQIGLED